MVVNYIQILYLCILKQHTEKAKTMASVVNYIQILYLCILKQLRCYQGIPCPRCELHSNLVSLYSETTLEIPEKTEHSCELHSNLVSLYSETTPS